MQDTEGTVATAGAPTRPVVVEKRVYVPHWPPEEFIVPLLRREIESCIERFFTPPNGAAKALDVGCGAQPFRGLLEQIGYSYCGVDVASTHGPDVVCAADEPLPQDLLQRGPFDFLLCTEVLEHVAAWHVAFGNLAQLLAPGGRVLITAPYFYQLHEEPYDFWRPTLHAIDYYSRQAGLRELYRKAAGDTWDVLGTTLSSCFFTGASNRLADRILAKGCRAARRFVVRALIGRKLRQHVHAKAPLYLSNIVVLEKPGHS